jgi:putative hydrolase of the HAD superfamily
MTCMLMTFGSTLTRDMISTVTTLLFDMDNTLFDLVGAQIEACRAVAGSVGQSDGESLFSDYFRSGRYGFESHENILTYLRDRNIFEPEKYSRARRIYETVKLGHIEPYEGVSSTLAEIRNQGYHLGIITDAHSRDATRRMEKTGLLPFFDGMVAYDMVMVKKPAKEPFLCALEMLKSSPASTLLIGDSPSRDIRPARDLGFRTVYARYGDRLSSTRECTEADFCINTLPELLPILRTIADGPASL